MSASSPNRPQASGVSALPGCYIFILGACLLVGTAVWAVYTFVRQADELEAFTDPEPAPLSVDAPEPARLEALTRRFSAFAEAAEAGQPAELAVTAEDLNMLLAGSPRLAEVKSLVRIRHLGPEGTFTADVRFPMNGLPGRRRYLNGEMDGRFGLHPEAGLFISVLDVRVPGRSVPAGFIEVYQRGIIPGKNFGFLDTMLVRNFREDPVFAGPLKRLGSFRYSGDSLIFSTSKPHTKAPSESAVSPVPAPESLKKP